MKKQMLDVDKINQDTDICFAHLPFGDGEKETIEKHISLCQRYFLELIEKKQIDQVIDVFKIEYFDSLTDEASTLFDEMVMNIVTFHDIGKINPLFQKKKMKHIYHKEMIEHLDLNIGSQHSILSAVMYLDYYLEKIKVIEDKSEKKRLKEFAYIFSFIISKHHSNLSEFKEYLKNFDKDYDGNILGYKAFEWLKCWKKEIYKEEHMFKIIKNSEKFLQQLEQEERDKSVHLYAITRLLYSLLVASDYYATSEFMNGIKINYFGEIEVIRSIHDEYENSEIMQSIRRYEKEKYPMTSEKIRQQRDINVLRSEIFLDAEKEFENNMDESVYYLEAPTGSGKSNTAINLSLKFMQYDASIRKIFYIYPFNTLVEQNMESLKKVFGQNENIMAQVAVVNSLVPIKDQTDGIYGDDQRRYQSMLLDRQFLNYPIVLSTHVMLFRTLFGDKKEDVFGFLQLCHSVIVMDEIQSYKNDIWGEMIVFLKAFAKLLGIKILIMSATLPNLELLTDQQNGAVILIKNRSKYFTNPLFAERVVANYDLLEKELTLETLAEEVCKDANRHQKVLIEFIKKSSAEAFYQIISEQTTQEVLLMTGDSSIWERKNIIQKVNETDALILIATQVIEAGVDIDMDIGYKNISKLDSEEQFMGRINRSCKRKGIVYFFKYDEVKKIYKNDIRSEQELTLKNNEMRKILDSKDYQIYYGTILEHLKKIKSRYNDQNLELFFRDTVGHLNMPDIMKRMQLIDDERLMISLYLARIIEDQNNQILDGKQLWLDYKMLLCDQTMNFAEKKVKLYALRSQMNAFIYQFSKNAVFMEDDRIGDLYYIENGEAYFDDKGVLKRSDFKVDDSIFI